MNNRAAQSEADRFVSHHPRGLSEIVNDIRDEALSFMNTRVRIIQAEMRESMGALKVGVPLAAICIGLLAISGLLLTAAAVTLVASAFAGNPYAWFFALIIIGVAWAMLAVIAGYFAMLQFRGRFPKRTVEVLRADKIWLEQEARSHS